MSNPITRLCVLVVAGAVAAAGAAGAATTNRYTASLSGKKEIGQGAPNGKGTFSANVTGTRLCYRLSFSGLTKPLAAHIHKGTAAQNGSIVTDLKPSFSNGKASKCVPVKSAVARAIRKNPAGYYANVHTQKYPDGAIRGQLSRH